MGCTICLWCSQKYFKIFIDVLTTDCLNMFKPADLVLLRKRKALTSTCPASVVHNYVSVVIYVTRMFFLESRGAWKQSDTPYNHPCEWSWLMHTCKEKPVGKEQCEHGAIYSAGLVLHGPLFEPGNLITEWKDCASWGNRSTDATCSIITISWNVLFYFHLIFPSSIP